jgi:hypothetical protein
LASCIMSFTTHSYFHLAAPSHLANRTVPLSLTQLRTNTFSASPRLPSCTPIRTPQSPRRTQQLMVCTSPEQDRQIAKSIPHDLDFHPKHQAIEPHSPRLKAQCMHVTQTGRKVILTAALQAASGRRRRQYLRTSLASLDTLL